MRASNLITRLHMKAPKKKRPQTVPLIYHLPASPLGITSLRSKRSLSARGAVPFVRSGGQWTESRKEAAIHLLLLLLLLFLILASHFPAVGFGPLKFARPLSDGELNLAGLPGVSTLPGCALQLRLSSVVWDSTSP